MEERGGEHKSRRKGWALVEVMTVKPEQIEALKPYIDNIEGLVESDDVQVVLDAIDDVIVENILANNDEPDSQLPRT